MVAQRGQYGDSRVLGTDICKTWLARPYPDGDYGFGWGLAKSNGAPPGVFRHSGALSSSRSVLVVVPNAGAYGVVHYTIAPANKKALDKVAQDIRGALYRSLILAAESATASPERR